MVKVKLIVFMLTSLNLLNWVDRGLIAGAGTLIKGCVQDVEHCGRQPKLKERCDDDPDDSHPHINTCSPRCRVCGDVCEDTGMLVDQTGFGMNDFDLGIIQSSFMLGYMGGSFIFSRAAHDVRVYRVLAYGMIVWTISGVISGCSGFFSDYSWSRYMLMLGRVLSGVGEAALATVALPHLDDILPEEIKGRYLAVFFAAVPVGNALGFVFAGEVSKYLSWKWTFLIEAMLMPPFIIMFLFHPKLQGFTIARNKRFEANALSVDAGEAPSPLRDSLLDHENSGSEFNTGEEIDTVVAISTSGKSVRSGDALWREIVLCMKTPTFVFASAGLAMFTFTAAGLGFYMPLFLQSYRPCDRSWRFSETSADEAFGLMVITSGFMGVLIGGWVLDWSPVRNYVSHAMKFCVAELALASFFLASALFATNVKVFFALAWFGTFIAFATTAPINRALMGSVPLEARSIAMALSVVIGHLFGDVPSPILIGAISDAHSPFVALGTAWMGFMLGTAFWAMGLWTSLRILPPDVATGVVS